MMNNVIGPMIRDYLGKKNRRKVPKRVHKSEREKMKREQLNELFFELSNAIELSQPNNGKASILCEATRLLKDLLAQIEDLRKENASLLSESHYVRSLKLLPLLMSGETLLSEH
jgi:hypothetical protein